MNGIKAPYMHRHRPDIQVFARKNEPSCLAEALTERERDILRLMADGSENKAIASVLGINWQTVRSHVSNILAKLGARNRTHAVHTAYQLGYIAPVEPDSAEKALELAEYYTAVARRLLVQNGGGKP